MARDFLKIRTGVSLRPGSVPGTPENGDIYYDSGSNLFAFYQNGSWVNINTTSGATTALDNLSAVAINTSLLPGVTNSIDLGSSSFKWRNLYFGTQSLGPDGSISAPAYSFASQTGMGVYREAANVLGNSWGHASNKVLFGTEANGGPAIGSNASTFYIMSGSPTQNAVSMTPARFGLYQSGDAYLIGGATQNGNLNMGMNIVMGYSGNTGFIRTGVGSAAAPAHSFIGGTGFSDKGLYSGGSDLLNLSVAGLNQLSIDGSTGNVTLQQFTTSVGKLIFGTDANAPNIKLIGSNDRLAIQGDAIYFVNHNNTSDHAVFGATSNIFYKPSVYYNTAETNAITFNVSASSATYSLTWPLAQGGASTTLTNDGSGNLSWTAISTGTTTGTGVAGRIAVWTGTNSQTSYAGLTSDASGNVGANSVTLADTQSLNWTTGANSASLQFAANAPFFSIINNAGTNYSWRWKGDSTNFMTLQSNSGTAFLDIKAGVIPDAANTYDLGNFGGVGANITTWRSIYFGTQIIGPSGSASAPSYSISGSLGTGIWSSAANTLDFATNGVNRLSMSAAGLLTHNPVTSTNSAVGLQINTGGLTGTGIKPIAIIGAITSSSTGIYVALSGSATSTASSFYADMTTTNTSNDLAFFTANGGNRAGQFYATSSNSTGSAVGFMGAGYGSKTNVGADFLGTQAASVAGNSTWGIRAFATGENTAQTIAVYGRLHSATSAAVERANPGVSAAGIFDNGDTSSDILNLFANSVSKLRVDSTGNLLASTDGGINIGASLATRPNNIFTKKNIIVGDSTAGVAFTNANQSSIQVGSVNYSADSVVTMMGTSVVSADAYIGYRHKGAAYDVFQGFVMNQNATGISGTGWNMELIRQNIASPSSVDLLYFNNPSSNTLNLLWGGDGTGSIGDLAHTGRPNNAYVKTLIDSGGTINLSGSSGANITWSTDQGGSIGTPSNRVDIVWVAGTIRNAAGSAAGPTYTFQTGGANDGMYRDSGTGGIGFSTANTARAIISSTSLSLFGSSMNLIWNTDGGGDLGTASNRPANIRALTSINLNSLTASTALVSDGSKNITSSSVTSTELGYLSGVTSAIQTQLTNKLNRDGTNSPTANINWGGFKITNAADPTAAQDYATKFYVDNVASGLDVKASVRVATTVNITLSGPQTIDGVSAIAGNRVLVKDQTTGTENGIYVVAAGAWSRSADADNSPAGEVTAGMFTFVEEGTVNADLGYVLVTNDPITLGTTSLVFSPFSSAGGGANKALSNLASVAINTSLLPGVTNSINLGSSSFAWSNLYIGTTGRINFVSNTDNWIDGNQNSRMHIHGHQEIDFSVDALSRAMDIYADSGINSIQIDSNILNNADNSARDIGRGTTGDISRHRNVYVGTNLFLGGAGGAGSTSSTSKIYFGSLATSTSWIGSGVSDTNDLRLYSGTGARIAFQVNNGQNALFLYGSAGNPAYWFTHQSFSTDNTLDVGNNTADDSANRARPRNLYVGTDLYLGGTAANTGAGSTTSTSKIYFGSQTGALNKIASDGSNLTFTNGGGATMYFYVGTTPAIIASLYNDGTEKALLAQTHLAFGNDNTLDIGNFEGGLTDFRRPRNVYVGTSVRSADGSVSAPSYTFTSATGMGLFKKAAGQLGLTASGTASLYLESAKLVRDGQTGTYIDFNDGGANRVNISTVNQFSAQVDGKFVYAGFVDESKGASALYGYLRMSSTYGATGVDIWWQTDGGGDIGRTNLRPNNVLVKNAVTVPSLILTGSTSGTITQQAANTTTSYSVKWPDTQGGANTFLKNDGSGNLSWASPTVLYTPSWVTQTFTFASFSTAALTNTISLYVLPAGYVLHEVVIKHSAPMSGAGLTSYTVSIGAGGNNTLYTQPFDVKQAVSNTGRSITQVEDVPNFGGTTNLQITATSTGANLNGMTSGTVQVWLLISQLNP